MPVVQQGPGHLGEVQVQVGQDEQLVPEDVAAVGLAVQSARRYAHVQVGGVRREGLEHVEEVQAQDAARLAGHLQFGAAPQLAPGGAVRHQQVVEAGSLGHPVDGGLERVTDRRVARGVQGDDLVDGGGAARPGPQGDALGDAQVLAGRGDRRVRGGAGGHAGPDVGGAGPAAQPHRVVPGGAGVHVREVVAVEVPVARHPGVGDAAVEGRLHLQVDRAALGGELGAQGGEVGVGHVYQPQLAYGQHAFPVEAEAGEPFQDARVQVHGLAVVEHLCGVGCEPVTAGGPEAQRQPVGEVDHVLVLDLAPRDGGDEPVVAAGHVGARVVHVVRGALGQRAAGGEVAVAQGAQGLPQPLLGGVVVVVVPGRRGRGHRGASQVQSATSGRSTPCSRIQSWCRCRASSIRCRTAAARTASPGTRSMTSMTRR